MTKERLVYGERLDNSEKINSEVYQEFDIGSKKGLFHWAMVVLLTSSVVGWVYILVQAVIFLIASYFQNS